MSGDADAEPDDETEEEPALGRPVQVNRADLLRGMICVGKKQAATLLRAPRRREDEVRGLAGLLGAYVTFEGSGPTRSAFFDELDSREKASFTYRLGMGLALLAAQEELGIPWLMHPDPLVASGTALVEPEDAGRTDLVGLSLDGRWSLVKARARSSEITTSVIDKTRRAVAEVAAVNDRPPAHRRACVAGLGETPFRVSFVPPDDETEPDGEEVELRVDPSTYITEYYAQFSFLTSLATREHGFGPDTGCGNLPPAVLAELEGTGYEIGLLAPLHAALQPPEERGEDAQTLDEAVPAKRGWEPQAPDQAREAGISVGRDGVVVRRKGREGPGR